MTESVPVLTQNLENLDRILDELEDRARSDLPTPQLFQILLERLKISLMAKCVAILMPVDRQAWMPFASFGADSAVILDEVSMHLKLEPPHASYQSGNCQGNDWVAVGLRPARFSKGCLVLCFDQPVLASSLSSILELTAAFAEIIAQRQTQELETFLDHDWQRTQELCQQIASAQELQESHCLLVNGLTQTLRAARVALVCMRASGSGRVQAISGTPNTNTSTRVAQNLCKLGQDVCKTGKPEWRQVRPSSNTSSPALAELGEDGLFSNLICVPFAIAGSKPSSAALVLEFQTQAELLSTVAKLPQLLPALSVAWGQHVRWLALPRFFRSLADKSLRVSTLAWPALKWCVLLGLVGLTVWGLRRPYPLVIAAEGSLEPVVMRTIYASADGLIDRLLIQDGEPVRMGQPLAVLRSPSLELTMEEAKGELRSIEEEIASVRIAMNQVDPNASELLNDQRRLASKIAQLETQQQSVQQRLEQLSQQEGRLKLVSPIDGVVDAKDVQQHLQQRPVRRGDPLFSVVDLEGPWQIRVNVADRDSGYVLRNYDLGVTHDDARHPAHRDVEFVMDNSPGSRARAELNWVADHVENLHGEGCFVEVRAITKKSDFEHAHAGAGVHAYFQCGEHPMWFVWCRPLVEAAQRRLWLRSNIQDE